MIWYKFFTFYFYNIDSGSIGFKLINESLRKKLNQRLNYLIDYHHKLWVSNENGDIQTNILHDGLTKLYRAYVTWLDDSHLHEVYVNLEELPSYYMIELLKSVMSNASERESLSHFLDLKQIEIDLLVFKKIWNELHLKFEDSQLNVQDLLEETASNYSGIKRYNLMIYIFNLMFNLFYRIIK